METIQKQNSHWITPHSIDRYIDTYIVIHSTFIVKNLPSVCLPIYQGCLE
jgi:hypothetical protein